MQPDARQEGLKDPLTGVYSRATLNARLYDEVERARRYGSVFSLLLLDIDHFKSVNDAFGHTRGDQVLVELAHRLGTITRSSDIIFRYGGDEFVILLPYTTKPQAFAISQRLLDGIRSTLFEGEPPLSISISGGVACFPEDVQTPEALFEAADQRHYQAKRSGRGQIVAEDPSQTVSLLEEPKRLIERDQALRSLTCFLDALPEQRRGVFQVTGPAGSGTSRFLAEIRKIARLRGYIVLALRGTPALKTRLYGAITEAQDGWAELSSPQAGKEAFTTALRQLLHEKGQAGLLIAVDNLPELDWGTLRLLRDLFSTDLPQLALAYTTNLFGSQLQLGARLQERVTLEPLSPDGIHIWLRDSLRWEAPLPFIEWFHRETGGLPAFIQQGLAYLVNQNILQPAPEGWTCRQDFTETRLAEQVSEQAKPPPYNLPYRGSDFVGRVDEIREVKRLIQEQRLITLLGPGGIGKTSLAIQVAAESLQIFPNGVYFAALAPINSPDFLASAIAEAVRISLSSQGDLKTQLLDYLRGKEVLLVLDNFEHLQGGTEFLLEILERAPGVKMLVTSRERLGVSDETIFEVGGLSLPSVEGFTEIENYGAVQLFLHSARRVCHSFTLSEEDRPSVVKICHLVEGMPLGIELAAAWVQMFSTRLIAEEIEDSLAFLGSSQANESGQHRGLQAVFDSFWKLLSEAEHRTLRKLSVFRGGFKSEAAQQIADASPYFLDGLVIRSHLHKTAQGRYEIHELLRQFAADKLQALPVEETQARDLHCDYYVDFLQKREEDLAFSHKNIIEEVAAEIENLRAAWHWAVSQARLAAILHSIPGLSNFFYQRSRYKEGEAILEMAVARLRTLGDESPTANQATTSERAEPPQQEVQPVLARLYVEQARFQNALAKYEQALATAHLAVDLAGVNQLSEVELLGHLQVGLALWRQGSYEAALAQLEQALSLARSVQSRRMEAESLRNIGMVLMLQGNYAQARTHQEQALALWRQIGDRRGESATLSNLGLIALYQDDYAEAKANFEQSLLISREIDNRHGESLAINNLGVLHRDQGEYVRARGYFEQALHLCREFGDRQGEGYAFGNLGSTFSSLGNYGKAKLHYEQALQLLREIGNRQGEGNTLANLCLVSTFLGDNDIAYDYGQQALLIGQELGERYGLGYALTNMGHTLTALGRLPEAADFYQQALTLRRELGQHNLAIESLAGLARVSLAQGDQKQSQTMVEEILRHLETKTLDGTDGPFWIYLTCYKVLHASGDPRARTILNTAHDLLQERASRIADAELQRSYLENVPAHLEIVREWGNAGNQKH